MKVRVKLFALLDKYLPPGAEKNQTEIEVEDGATAQTIIAELNLPPEMCHLILVNGHYLDPEERQSQPLRSTDVLAIWPPIADGRG